MKILLIIAAVLVVSIAAVLIVGAMLPKQHTASRSATFKQDRRAVYAVVRNLAAHPQWRDGVRKIEILDATRFREHSTNGVIAYDIVEDKPAERFVTRIADRDLGYSGSWTFVFDDATPGSRLTITENGEVSNVLFRFLSRFVFGHSASIDAYLRSLQKRMG